MRPLPHIWNESSKFPAKREREPDVESKPEAKFPVKDESIQDYRPHVVTERGQYNLKDESIKDYKPSRAYEVAEQIEEWLTEEVHHVGEIPGSHDTTFTLPHSDGKLQYKTFSV